jgi:hypothetical protein
MTHFAKRDQGMLLWALLDFQTPLHSLVIGSRLDTVDNSTGTASSCRLAFSGRLMERILTPKRNLTASDCTNPRNGAVSIYVAKRLARAWREFLVDVTNR